MKLRQRICARWGTVQHQTKAFRTIMTDYASIYHSINRYIHPSFLSFFLLPFFLLLPSFHPSTTHPFFPPPTLQHFFPFSPPPLPPFFSHIKSLPNLQSHQPRLSFLYFQDLPWNQQENRWMKKLAICSTTFVQSQRHRGRSISPVRLSSQLPQSFLGNLSHPKSF